MSEEQAYTVVGGRGTMTVFEVYIKTTPERLVRPEDAAGDWRGPGCSRLAALLRRRLARRPRRSPAPAAAAPEDRSAAAAPAAPDPAAAASGPATAAPAGQARA